MRYLYLLIILLFAGINIPAQTTGIKTYCNPMDINYQYNFEQRPEGISYRSAADPVIITHKGEYYLFATISGGWWNSTDRFRCWYIIR